MSNIVVTTIALTLGLPALCQTTINSVRVYTEPEWLNFTLDGQPFLNAGEFLWPDGSKHTVASDNQFKFNGGPAASYEYSGWVTNLNPNASPANEQPITASPELKWIKLIFKTSYAISISLAPCSEPKQGRIEGLTPDPLECDFHRVFVPAGKPVTLRAYPNPGHVFRGWGPGSGIATTAFEISFVANDPRALTPQFLPTGTTQVNASIQTDPAGLEILADRTPYTAPAQLEWQWGSVHTVGASALQMYNGQPYVFQAWSDGGSVSHDITVPPGSRRIDLTARFVRGASVIFRTSPQGLKLTIDGDRSLPAYDFTWAPGSTHTISAPETQTDASGRKYEFVSWTRDKPATFAYTVGEGASADVMTATYRTVGRISVASDPSGLTIRVDGENCVTPCVIDRPVGAIVQLIAADAIEVGAGGRLVFDRWRDASTSTRSVTAAADPATYTAEFKRQFRLSLDCNPAGGALLQSAPSSADGYYDAATPVSVSARVNLGFRMLGWSGDLTGRGATASVYMDSPKSAILQLESVPAIATPGVWNSAPEAPARGVAPGSLISIYGAHLAPEVLAGNANPLPQTLGGVTVRVDDSFLPLLFVSPDQINAQLVSTVEPGPHKLIVRIEGKPEVSVDFDVARNAPGLFTRTENGVSVGLFAHANGALVSAEDPAQSGETVSVFGSGLGPYRVTPPDGFLVGESDAYSLSDDVHVVADGVTLDPVYVGRTNVGVAVDAIRFIVPLGPPPSGVVRIKVAVNGNDSNTVSLPVTSGTTAGGEFGK